MKAKGYKEENSWDAESGFASVTITDSIRNISAYGGAFCHEDDEDMKTEITGCSIAYSRAAGEYLKKVRDNIKAELKSLKQFYYSINMNKEFDSKNYMVRTLKRQIKMREADLRMVNEEIKENKSSRIEYIKEKDKFYNKIRNARDKVKDNAETLD